MNQRRRADLRRTDRFMSARRRQAWWQRNRRQIAQELRALLPRIDWRQS